MRGARNAHVQFFPNQSAFFGFSDSFFPISKKRMTRPLRATEGTVADKERNRERERSKDGDAFSATHLWAMTTTFATTLCRLFHQSVVGFGKEFRFNLFKERTSSSSQRREEKSASNSFLFFRKTASSGGRLSASRRFGLRACRADERRPEDHRSWWVSFVRTTTTPRKQE